MNCAAIPSELIESELFGHERGAFTSAIKQRKGKFEQADGGTLFMDEIGDMSPAAQAKVLRALQERRISRVGSDKDIEVDVRVVAATNKDLREEIRRGNFREDLYHRIGVIVVRVPALREHAADIPLLTDHFIRLISAEYGLAPKPIDPEAVAALQAMPWSGNVRELRNVVERLLILSDGRITAANCCALNDGAAALVIMSDTKAEQLGLTPLARVVSTGVSGLSPEIMGLGPVEASKQALKRAGMGIGDIDLVEINEAFAAQVIPSYQDLGIPLEKLNVNGGAIAVGHPFGMTGARITTTLLNSLQWHDKQFGLETMCVGGGQGMAMVLERLS